MRAAMADATASDYAVPAADKAVEVVEAKAEQTRAATESSYVLEKRSHQIAAKSTKKPAADGVQHSPTSKHMDGNPRSEAIAHWRAVQAALGDFLETAEAQVGLILLIGTDVCASAAQIYIQKHRELVNAYQSRGGGIHGVPVSVEYGELGVAVAARVLAAISTLAMGIYLLELVVLLALFRRKFLAHSGYMLDATLVAASLAIEAWTESKAVRLLGILRVWRVFRVVSTVVDRERASHEESKTQLDLERANAAQLRMEKLAAEESLKREYASRTGLERLLYDYKDEVATLKEALEIAAQAVAEAEMLHAQHEGESLGAAAEFVAADSEQQQSQLVDESAYSFETEAYDHYQQAPDPADASAASPQKLHRSEGDDDSESDFEDAIQSDGEPRG